MLHRDWGWGWVWGWVWVWLLLVSSPGSHGDPQQKDSQLICSHQPIVALVGEDVILPCRLEPPMGPGAGRVLWSKPGLDRKFILVYHQGRMIREEQNPAYEKRTFLFEDQLKDGNVSLKLSGVKVSDEGTYVCAHEAAAKTMHVNVMVGAVSKPAVKDASNASGPFLRCESSGWFPEPEVFWRHNGNHFSEGPTAAVRRPDGLFNVSSTVQVKEAGLYTCGVHQRKINRTRAVQVRFQRPPVESPSVMTAVTTNLLGFVLIVVSMQETYIFAVKRFLGFRGILTVSMSLGIAVLVSVVSLLENHKLSEDVSLFCSMVGFTVLLGITDLSLIFITMLKKYNARVSTYCSHLTKISASLFVVVVVLQMSSQLIYFFYWMDYNQVRHTNLLLVALLGYLTLLFIMVMVEEADLVVVSRRWKIILGIFLMPVVPVVLYLLMKLVMKCIRRNKQPVNDVQPLNRAEQDFIQMSGRLLDVEDRNPAGDDGEKDDQKRKEK
ncbi:uncharacterized protein V6R79_014763 [Siganus canaliculatus]